MREIQGGEGDGKVTVSCAQPTESWLSLKPYSIFDTEWGTASRPIGWQFETFLYSSPV